MAPMKSHRKVAGDTLSSSDLTAPKDSLSARESLSDSDTAPDKERSWPPAQLLPVLVLGGSDRLQQLFNTALTNCQLIAIDTPAELIHRWQAEPGWMLIDLATASYPGGDSALDVLEALGQVCHHRPLPVILLVAPGQEREALEAMKLGAADYLFTTDLSAEVLGAKLSLPTDLAPPVPNAEQLSQPYRDLVEHSPDIVERFDCDLRRLYVSPVLTELTGLDTEALLGKTCRELGLDEIMVNTWEAAAAKALATGENQSIEFSTPTLLGVRHFEMAIAPERDEGGDIISLLCISRDITDRIVAGQMQQQQLWEAQTAQAQATSSQDLLNGVLNRINDGIVALDADQRLTFINHRAAEITGRSAAELMGHSIWDAFPEAISQPFYTAFQRAIDQQSPVYEEHYYAPFDRWFENRIYPSTDGTTIYFTDISDRKTAEKSHQNNEQLRQELSLLEQTLESILAGYWDVDFVANTAYLSPGLKRMFGYADHELPNRPDTWQNLIFAEDLPIALDCLSRHIESRGQVPYYNEVRYRHKDGSTVWVLCAGRVIDWDEAGQPGYMVGCHVDITLIKQTETQLKRSAAHLREAQRIGNLGSWEFEVANECVTWSDQLCHIFGRPSGHPPADFEALQALVHPDDRDHHRQTVEALLTTHQPYDEEFRFLLSDGSVRHLQIKGEVVVNAAGALTHLTGTALDVSDRKRHEANLQSLSLRLSLALQSARIGTWERDMITNEIIWDQCLIDLYGFERLGRNANYVDWRAQVYADDIERVETGHQALLDRDAPYDIEFRIWRGDGSLGWIRSSALVQRDPQGQPLSVIGVNYDITDQKCAETQLRDLTMRLELALESGGIGAWEIDLASLEATWDGRMYAMYGLAPSEEPLTFHDWRSCVHIEDVDYVDVTFAGLLAGSVDSTVEFRILRGDGEQRWIRATALVQYDDDQPRRLIGTNVDITAAKQAEAHLLRTTAQLTASNRELEAFAYSVSHDLRAPLRAIDGFSRALVEDYGDQFGDEGRDYFDRIRHNVGRMGQLIDDLLRLSRVSRSAMSYASVDLSTLVQTQIDDLRAADPDRALVVTITPDLVVTADPTLMQVAIANLVQNAWKFTSHHPTAHLEFGAITQNGEIAYYLRDDGAGFDMAYADKLFGVFQRLHNTDEFPGTGIGLATVQRAIHRHSGRVWAEGAVEQGATVYFTLPQQSPLPEVAP